MGMTRGDRSEGGAGPAGVRLDDYVLQRRLPNDGVDDLDVWLAREADGIGEVLVHVLVLPSDPSERADLLERADACVDLVGPQLARGREVVIGEHAMALVHDVPAGRPWADAPGSPLDLERGRSAAQRLGWPLAPPAAGGAWITSSGRVLVVPIPLPVARATSVLADDRDSAASLRSRIARPDRRLHRRRVEPAVLRTAGIAVGVLVIAVAVGLASVRVWQGGTSSAAQALDEAAVTTSTAVPTLAEPDWRSVLERLDSLRAGAFAAADPSAVGVFAVQGSAAAEQDRAVLGELAARGVRADGFAPVVEQVSAAEVAADRAVLEVVDAVPAYRLIDQHGVVVSEEPARPSMSWRVELASVEGEWRVAAVSPA